MHHPLKYAQIERERRYLVRAVPDGVRYVDEIEDAYIEGTRLRLRRVTSQGEVTRKLGHKIRLGLGPREVASTSLYLDDAEWDQLSALPVRRLRKRRHHVVRDGHAFAVDEFPDGTLLAEFDDGDGPPTGVPAWLEVVADVTDDEEWTGAGRAARPMDPHLAPG
jgi:CYTH domain-containing protein